MILGAHESIAGGPSQAFARAEADSARAMQIFTRSSRSWRAKPLEQAEAERFRAEQQRTGIVPLAHGSYLTNLASGDAAIREKSLACFHDELSRCEALGVPYLVVHPGANKDEGRGRELIAQAIDEVHSAHPAFKSRVALETHAGQGTTIGHTFEALAAILERVKQPERVAICVDTCHLWAAGYDIASDAGYDRTFERFDQLLGLGRIGLFHLNDSKKGLGCRVDRHEDIGQGTMGLSPFRRLLKDPRFQALPGVLETPSEEKYRENLDILRGLA